MGRDFLVGQRLKQPPSNLEMDFKNHLLGDGVMSVLFLDIVFLYHAGSGWRILQSGSKLLATMSTCELKVAVKSRAAFT